MKLMHLPVSNTDPKETRLARRLWMAPAAFLGGCLAGLLAAAAFTAREDSQIPAYPPLRPASWEDFQFDQAGSLTSPSYNLRMTLKRRGKDAFRMRVLLDQQDTANYSFLELSDQATRFGRVEQGLERKIGRPGRPVASDTPERLLVIRRELEMKAYLSQEAVASAWDGRFSGGLVSIGVMGQSAEVESFRLQPVEDILFSDDFMKAATESSEWQSISGRWHVETLKNPALSSNAFYYVGTSENGPALAAAGYWFWDSLRFQISCRPTSPGAVGLMTGYQDQGDGYLFRWFDSVSRPQGHRQLIAWRDRKEEVLASSDGGYNPGQWYRLEMAARGNEISASIDGTTVLRARDDRISCGRIGIYVESAASAHFDDAYAVSEKSFHDSFDARPDGRWLPLDGNWEASGSGRMQVRTDRPAKAVCGSIAWKNYRIAAELVEWKARSVGLCSCYQDEGQMYLLRWLPDKQRVQLLALEDGAEAVLAEQPWAGPSQDRCRLELEVTEGLVTGAVGNQVLLQAAARPGLLSGQPGLFTDSGQAAFDEVSVEFPKIPQPLLTLNEVFAGENSMAEWSAKESDWIPRRSTGGQPHTPSMMYWHRTDFPGDAEIELALPESPQAPATYGLTLAAEDDQIESGYTLKFQNGHSPALSLFRQGKRIEEKRLDRPIRSVKFGRKGRFLQVSADWERVWAWRDEQPLPGCRVAVWTSEEEFDTARAEVSSPNVYSYNFQQAPCEWRQAGGLWSVTSRWQCDPRWSFFTGESDRVAAIWNKRRFLGDLTLEFTASIKMNSARGNNYEYASDINASLCGDGKSLTSGYSFLFGGKGNHGSYLLRRSRIVAECPVRIPLQVLHRRWFNLKIRKRGGLLTLWTDHEKILEYSDPQPLEGPELALWTYRNGIQVTRVRISSESGQNMETPDAGYPAVSLCYYDETSSENTGKGTGE